MCYKSLCIVLIPINQKNKEFHSKVSNPILFQAVELFILLPHCISEAH